MVKAETEKTSTAAKKTTGRKTATKKATSKKAATKKVTKKSVKKTPAKKKATKASAELAALPPDTPMTELLGESFLKDLVDDWQSNGAGVIEECRVSKPEAYLRLIAAYAPKELRKQLRPFGNIDDETLLKELKHALSELQELGIEASPGTGA